jgi:hypothetical protein
MPSECKNTLVIKGDVINFILDHKLYNNDFCCFVEKRYVNCLWKYQHDAISFFLNKLSCSDVDILENMMTVKKSYLDLNPVDRYDLELLDFSVLIPIPLEVDSYDWCTTFWGTKWNPGETNITFISKERIEFEFETVWNPPLKWLKYASEYYSYLCFDLEYSESGNDYYGCVSYEYGKETKNIYSTNLEFLKTEPNLNKTINLIKKIPFKYDYEIYDYINLFEKMIEEGFVNFDEFILDDVTNNQIEIYTIIETIWDEYVSTLDNIYYDISCRFYDFLQEILNFYIDIENTINIILKNRMKKNIKKWSSLNKINREIIEFGYIPEDTEKIGTILGMGGYIYRESKENFYSLIKLFK